MPEAAPATWNEFRSQTWLRARREGIPLSGTFELTPLCNFRCQMCYVRLDELPANRRLRSAAEWLDLARQAADAGTYAVTLTGGEPLSHPEFPQIYRSLSEMGLFVSVLSNGTLITGETARLFRDYPPANLRITVYGASNETYRLLCGAPRGFDLVTAALDALDAEGVPYSLAFTRTRLNETDAPAVALLAQERGVPISFGNDLVPAVRGATSRAGELRVPRSERMPVERPLEGACRAPEQSLSPAAALPPDVTSGPFGNCSAYRTSFFVSWEGLMEGCSLMSHLRLRPFEDGFSRAWAGLLDGLGKIALPERCRTCDAAAYCSSCPGRREAETGDPEGLFDPRCREAHDLKARLNNVG